MATEREKGKLKKKYVTHLTIEKIIVKNIAELSRKLTPTAGYVTTFSGPVLVVLERCFKHEANSALVNAEAGPSWLLVVGSFSNSVYPVYLISEQ